MTTPSAYLRKETNDPEKKVRSMGDKKEKCKNSTLMNATVTRKHIGYLVVCLYVLAAANKVVVNSFCYTVR